ncbi:MAG: hypothetical protein IPO05_09430 [Flavobacteriales bacterium]|nr:hypothetical protein [Flavobacteriales bacterium]
MTTINVTDVNPPVAVCQPITVTLDASGNATITSAQLDGGSTDNGTIVSLVASQTSFDCSDLGTVTVTLTVTDDGGNVTTCNATVTVVDNTAPIALCQNVTVALDASGNTTVTATQVDNGSNDACGIASLSLSQTAFDCSNVGVNNVTLTVTDPSGNVSTCAAVVTVVDNSAPSIVCNSITVSLDNNGQVVVNAADVATATTDNCGGGQITYSLSTSTFTAVGSYTVTVTATDAAGNSSNCVTTINVTDVNPPSAICQPITVTLDASGNATINSTDLDGGSTDNGTIVSIVASQTSFECTDLGTVTVTLTVTDDGGNVSTCDATVTVVDNTAPVALCQNMTVALDASGNATVTATQVDNGSNDACGIASLSLSQTAFDCSNVGANNVTLTVTDNNGNTATCNATVTVVDNSAPSIVCNSITVSLDSSTGDVTVDAADVATATTDNCGGGQISYSLDVNTFTAVGSYTVTVTATDAAGNSSSCVTTINVTDVNPPVAVCQPITVTLDASGNATINSTDLDGGSTDNGTIVSIVASQTSFDCTDVGTVTVTLTVTDDGGNVSTCDATVTVVDNTAPVALCQNVTVTLDASGNATVTAAQVDNGSNDNCGVASISLDQTSFDCSQVGANTVTLTVTDTNGNVSTCTATVTVVDNSAPIALCQNVTVTLDASGNASVTAAQVDNGSNDNCGIASISMDQTSFDCSQVGANAVTLTVTDTNGNVSTCTATVTVVDNNAPIALCQNVTVTLDASGNASVTAAQVDNGSNDNCGVASISLSQTSFDCSQVVATP